MQQFDQLLADATAQVTQSYFRLSSLAAEPVYRERVYCYELYHQMRLNWPGNTDYFLNGEYNKSGHPYFPGSGGPQPDFLIHVPQSEDNFAVIEVKSCELRTEGILEDVSKLRQFQLFGYQRAIYLIYGHLAQSRVQKIQNLAGHGSRIEIWLHVTSGTPAQPYLFLL